MNPRSQRPTLLILLPALVILLAGCQEAPQPAPDRTAHATAHATANGTAGAAPEGDPVQRSGHDAKAVIARLEGRWTLADDGHGPAAWGVAGATLVRRGADGEAREGWIEAPLPGLLRVHVAGMTSWELGVATDAERVALGPGRAGRCDPQGCWLADSGLVHRDADGQCWWYPHRVGGGSIPRFLSPVPLKCTQDSHTFTYHLPRRARPDSVDRRQLHRDGNLLLEPQVVFATRTPAGPPVAAPVAPLPSPNTTAPVPEGGALRPNPAP